MAFKVGSLVGGDDNSVLNPLFSAPVGLPGGWTSVHAPAAAAQATILKAAGAAGVKHVCSGISASIATGATAQTPVNVYVRDGLTGAGTILWAGVLACPANSVAAIVVNGLYLLGTAATGMCLEFSAAGVAASVEAVTMTGYDTT